MANEEHVRIVRKGAKAIQIWRAKHLGTRLDLMGADLSGATLCKANFVLADIRDANLTGADLRSANFTLSILTRTKLRGADLCDANLQGACVFGADFSGAIFGAHLYEGRTALGGLDLSVAKLQGCNHRGPSSIGLDTILKSKGQIPDEFLRGCGYDPTVQRILLGDRKALTDASYKAGAVDFKVVVASASAIMRPPSRLGLGSD